MNIFTSQLLRKGALTTNETAKKIMAIPNINGARAIKKVREAGGTTIAELPDTAIAYSMPKEAIRKGGAEIVAPSNEIADKIMKAVNKN